VLDQTSKDNRRLTDSKLALERMPTFRLFGMDRYAGALLLALLLTLQPFRAHADLPDTINAIRVSGCGGRPGVNRPLHPRHQLDEVARGTANGRPLHDALLAGGYNAAQSSSIHVATPGGDMAIGRLLAQHFCAQISEPAVRDMGIAQHGIDTWIVLATPLVTPSLQDAPAVSRRVLELVNQARAHPRSCGSTTFSAASSLKLSRPLTDAALEHSFDMAKRNYFDHHGADGSTPESRVTHAGYSWRVVGENIAAGVPTPEEVVQGWLQSAAHCQNLMDPRFTDMGVAYVVDPKNPSVIVWTQVFAVPRSAGRPHA
jgi:uncharacterized protein YkwD